MQGDERSIGVGIELCYSRRMEKTLIVWRRLGKEHGEHRGFKVDPANVVEQHLREKVDSYRQIAESEWRWWQITDSMIIERPIVAKDSQIVSDHTVIYYLLERNWVVMQNVDYPGFAEWPWYVHIGDISFYADLYSYVMRDLFCDILIKENCSDHTVLDLDELGMGHDLGLITTADLYKALTSAQNLVDQIRSGLFPPEEIIQCQEEFRSLGWW